MESFAWFDTSFALRLLMTLIHFVWQGVAVGVLVAAGAVLLRSASAQWRYVSYLSALALMAACVPVTFVVLDVPETRSAPAALPLVDGNRSSRFDVEGQDLPRSLFTDSAIVRHPSTSFPTGETSAAVPSAHADREQTDRSALTAFVEWIGPAAPYLILVYLVGVVLMLIRLATGVWGGHRLRRAATPVDDTSLLTMVARQAKRIGLRVAPALAWSGQVSIPVVIGILRPMVLLPAALATGLSPEQVQALVTHELAHIRRCDLLVNLLQRVIEALLFFHPAVWYVSRRISIERENAADDLVLAAGWWAPHYADALVRMAEVSSAHRQASITNQVTVLAASGANGSEFKRRVMRLLDARDTTPIRLTRTGLVMLALILAASLFTPIALHALAQSRPPSEPVEKKEKNEEATTLSSGESAPGTTINKTHLPKVSKTLHYPIRVNGRTVSGGGIIERIEGSTLLFTSGDRIDIDNGTRVLKPRFGDHPPRLVKPSLLEPGMAIGYSMRDGQITSVVLVGISENPPASMSAFDRIKELGLRPGGEVKSDLSGEHPLRLVGKKGEATIKIGETKLIEMPKPTTEVEWRTGEFLPEVIDDVEPFDYLLIRWHANGRITWTCYQSPEISKQNEAKDGPASSRTAPERIQKKRSKSNKGNGTAAAPKRTSSARSTEATRETTVTPRNPRPTDNVGASLIKWRNRPRTEADEIVAAARAKSLGLSKLTRMVLQSNQWDIPVNRTIPERSLEALQEALLGRVHQSNVVASTTTFAWEMPRLLVRSKSSWPIAGPSSPGSSFEWRYWDGTDGWYVQSPPSRGARPVSRDGPPAKPMGVGPDGWNVPEPPRRDPRSFMRFKTTDEAMKLPYDFAYMLALGSRHFPWPGERVDFRYALPDPSLTRYRKVGSERIRDEECDVFEGPARYEMLWIGQSSGRIRAYYHRYLHSEMPDYYTNLVREVTGRTFNDHDAFWSWWRRQPQDRQVALSAHHAAAVWPMTKPAFLYHFSGFREIAPGVEWPMGYVGVVFAGGSKEEGFRYFHRNVWFTQPPTVPPYHLLVTDVNPREGDSIWDERFDVPFGYTWDHDRTEADIQRMADDEHRKVKAVQDVVGPQGRP